MKTKEAIDYVESKRYTMDYCDNNKLADEVISLLKRGEKYEEMWERLKMKYGIRLTKLPMSADLESLYELMKINEQKCFPKEKTNV